jgi:hypothetical protein
MTDRTHYPQAAEEQELFHCGMFSLFYFFSAQARLQDLGGQPLQPIYKLHGVAFNRAGEHRHFNRHISQPIFC